MVLSDQVLDMSLPSSHLWQPCSICSLSRVYYLPGLNPFFMRTKGCLGVQIFLSPLFLDGQWTRMILRSASPPGSASTRVISWTL